MAKGTKKIIFFSTTAIIIGSALYYFLVYKKNKIKGKRADFNVDGFVYTVGTKAQAYPKKAGEFGGMLLESYKEDNNFWYAKNSTGQPVLLKKSEVKIV